MAGLFIMITASSLVSTILAESASYPGYYYYPVPVEHRSALVGFKETFPSDAYDYTIVSADEYPNFAVAKPSTGLSLWDCIPDPITAITTIGSTALSVVRYLLPQVIWIAVGAILIIGFCTFTPYCTLIFEKPFSHELRTLGSNCLDYAEDLFHTAYQKFNKT